MNLGEFSDSIDSLLASYSSQAVFGEGAAKSEIVLDEYEKSVLLSQAQDIIVKSYFDRRKNAPQEGFDDTTERQIDFSSLITTADLEKAEDQSTIFDDRGIIYTMPIRHGYDDIEGLDLFDETFDETFHPDGDQYKWVTTDVLFILNEKLVCRKGNLQKTYVVVPINYREYDREMSKPYAQPLKKQAWRLFQNNTQGFDIKSELIPRWNLGKDEVIEAYRVRYIRRPTPIILVDLPNGLEIDGYSKAMECELNPILHPEVLNKAVELAIQTRGGSLRVAQNGNQQ